MFSSSPFALLDMPLLNVEGGRDTFLTAPHPQPSPVKADGGWQGGMLRLLICWEAGQGSLRADTPQQKKSDLVAGESDFGLPLLLSLPPALLEWIHESVQSIPSLFISDFLASVNEIQPFSHCWLCWPVEPSIRDHFRRVSWVLWSKLTSPKSFPIIRTCLRLLSLHTCSGGVMESIALRARKSGPAMPQTMAFYPVNLTLLGFSFLICPLKKLDWVLSLETIDG